MPPRATKAKAAAPERAAAPEAPAAGGGLFLVTGSDAGGIRQRARELVAGLCGGDPAQDPAVEQVAGDRDGARPAAILAEVFASLAAPPFLTPRKIIWLRNFDFAAARKDKRGAELLEALEERLGEGLPADVALVLEGPGLDGRSRLIKTCRKLGEAIVLAQPDPNDRKFYAEQVRAIIDEHCRAIGLRLDPEAGAYLQETAGGDPGRLRTELDKLAAYVHPAKEASLAACRAICSHTPEAAAWAFANALGRRDLAESLAALDQLLASRAEPIAVMAGVTSLFQLMLQARMAAPALKLAPGCPYPRFQAAVTSPPPQVKAELGETFLLTANPYRAWRVFTDSHQYADDELRQAFAHLVEASRQLVSGAMDQRLALERLAVNLCRKKPGGECRP